MTVTGRKALAAIVTLLPLALAHAKELKPSPPPAVAAEAVKAAEAAKPADDAKPGPKMVVEKDVFDAGQVVRGSMASATFTIKNEGTEPLKILSAKPG